jgi:transcriptional regulator with XRE-family HTH domain
MEISENFKAFRIIFNYTQDRLSKALSLDQVTIANYETGKIKPSYQVLQNIIKLYGISLDYFVFDKACSYPRNLKLLRLAKLLDKAEHSDSRSSIENVVKTLLKYDVGSEMILKQDVIELELTDSFYKNLKELRNYKKLTQPQLSEKLRITRSAYAQYEVKNFPPLKKLIELSDSLDISMHALITGEKLFFDFDDRIFGRTILYADQSLSMEDHKVLVRLLEATINKK